MTASLPQDIGQQMQPLAEKLQAIARPLAGDDTSSAARHLAPFPGQIAKLVAYVLRNVGESESDNARYNLRILHDLAERLTATTRSALAEHDEPLPKLHGHCIARVALDETEVEWLSVRPYAAHEVKSTLYCDLEAGHAGTHAALGQQGNQIEWWVLWTLRAFEIVERQVCAAEAPGDLDDGEDREICLLYAGHPGRHSFEIR